MRFNRLSLGIASALGLVVAASAIGQQLGQNLRNGPRTAPPRLSTNGPVAPPRPPPPLPPRHSWGTVATPQASEKPLDHEVVTKDGKFKLDFDKVEITDLVQNISDITG